MIQSTDHHHHHHHHHIQGYFPSDQIPIFTPPNFHVLDQTNSAPLFGLSLPDLSCMMISNNSTSGSDEADEMSQVSIVEERKKRRMISNRESARRSRMRKQRQLDELWSQVVRLRTQNHNLLDKLNNLSESHDKVVEENAKLKEEASHLRALLKDISSCGLD